MAVDQWVNEIPAVGTKVTGLFGSEEVSRVEVFDGELIVTTSKHGLELVHREEEFLRMYNPEQVSNDELLPVEAYRQMTLEEAYFVGDIHD